jgi:hypothetical protein
LRTCANLDDEDGKGSTIVLHSRTTFDQLSSIEAETLRAPEGDHDDHADAFALAQAGREQLSKKGQAAVLLVDSVNGRW